MGAVWPGPDGVAANGGADSGVLGLARPQRGHFELGTGYHGDVWLDLDALFLRPARLAPYVGWLADRLREHQVDAVCGPLDGGAFLALALATRLEVAFLPGYRTPAAPPGYRTPAAPPGYRDSAALPGYRDSAALPGYRDSAALPGYRDSAALPGYRDSAALPGYRDSAAPPGYRLPSVAGGIGGWRVAIADDAVNAGTAIRACFGRLRGDGAVPVAVAALLALGPAAAVVRDTLGIPLYAAGELRSQAWPAGACPLCASGTPLSEPRTAIT